MPIGREYKISGFFAQLCFTKITSLIMHLYSSTFINAKLLREQVFPDSEDTGFANASLSSPHGKAG